MPDGIVDSIMAVVSKIVLPLGDSKLKLSDDEIPKVDTVVLELVSVDICCVAYDEVALDV